MVVLLTSAILYHKHYVYMRVVFMQLSNKYVKKKIIKIKYGRGEVGFSYNHIYIKMKNISDGDESS